ncbi:hypothetical protein [Actinophytocola oryzae]|uniref:hypothetical protein n=1 Tax=Actinophytocola oryzae TaxID=502181 RepID=UPI001AAEC5E5|nr:hypothetical protein [Actinophytocola oryzae]
MSARKNSRSNPPPQVRTRPSSDDAHAIVFFQRHVDDDPDETVPGRVFLRETCPAGVRAKFFAVLNAVAAAPPKRFAGGGAWEAMHGDMTGWFEVRKDGPGRHHYRLFCLLDYEARGQDKPLLTIIDGRDKPFRTELSSTDYAAVRSLGDEYLKRNPRSLH